MFLWLLLGPRVDGWAIAVLAAGGITDWLDGKLARLLGQYSRLGELLDPAVDRLYVLAALLALGWREIVPWWVVGVIVGSVVRVHGAIMPWHRLHQERRLRRHHS